MRKKWNELIFFGNVIWRVVLANGEEYTRTNIIVCSILRTVTITKGVNSGRNIPLLFDPVPQIASYSVFIPRHRKEKKFSPLVSFLYVTNYEELGRKDQNKREAGSPGNSRKVSSFLTEHFSSRGEDFLDQLPRLTAIVVIFENAQLAARAPALEAVN